MTDDVTLRQTAHVRWCRTDRPDLQRAVQVDSCGKKCRAVWLGDLVDVTFSPDSRHLAVATPHDLSVIDVDSGPRQQLTANRETIDSGFSFWHPSPSVAWLNNSELIYATHSERREKPDRIDRTFWRQNIRNSAARRLAIYQQQDVEAETTEFISPDGRHALINGCNRRPPQLLNTIRGTVHDISDEYVGIVSVAWKPDGTEVLCIGLTDHEIDRLRCVALLIDLGTGETQDFGPDFGWGPWECIFTTEPQWTKDGAYLLADMPKIGRCLIQLDPWQVTPVGKRFSKAVFGDAEEKPAVGLCPQAGWVWAWGSDEKAYAMDYSGNKVVPLFDKGRGSKEIAWSPDGQLVAQPDHDKRLHIHRVALATQQP